MGINVQATKTKDTLKDFNNTVNSATTSAIQTQAANCTSGNTLTFDSGGSCPTPPIPPGTLCCMVPPVISGSTITINQTSQNGCIINQQNKTSVSNTDYNKISTAAQQFITNDLNSKTGWLAIGLSVQTSTSITKEDIENRISNVTKTDFTQSCKSSVDSYNRGVIFTCDDIINSDITINQNSMITAISSCTNNAILTNFFNTTELQTFAQNTNNHFLSTQSGIGSLFKWFIIGAIIIVALILLVGGGIYLLSGSGDDKKKEQQQQQQEQQLLMMEELQK